MRGQRLYILEKKIGRQAVHMKKSKHKALQAVIIAGGKGTRLSEYTSEIPKPMIPIEGKPVLEHQIEALKRNGIRDIYITVGYLKQVIMDYFGDGTPLGVHITYIIEEKTLGTAGAFFFLKKHIKGTFFVVFGDILFDMELRRLQMFHKSNGARITLVAHPNSHPFDSDLIICDKMGHVVGIDRKGQKREGYYANLVNAGAYMMEASILEWFHSLQRLDLEKDVIAHWIRQGGVCAYRTTEYLKDMGTYKRLDEVGKQLREGLPQKRCLERMQRCIFLDRDGTINQKRGLVYKPEDFILETGVIEAIKKINESGFLCIVVSNQPVIARNLCTVEELELIHKKMETLLGQQGAFLDDIFYCPHHPDKGYPEERPEYKIECRCRKPGIGMIEEAIRKYEIDVNNSYLIGDTTVDIMTGKNASMKTILVLTGDRGLDDKFDVRADMECETLEEAVDAIISGTL